MLIRGPTQYKTQQLTQHCYDALAIIRYGISSCG